MIKPAGAGDT